MFPLCINALNLINLLLRADKIMVLSSKGMLYLQFHEKFLSLLNLDFFFPWGSMSKFPKHWKVEKNKVHFVGDFLIQPVTVKTSACLMPDGTQSRAFRSSSNTCCLSTENAPTSWPWQAQQQLRRTAPVWITLPSLTERALKSTDSYISHDFLVISKDSKVK